MKFKNFKEKSLALTTAPCFIKSRSPQPCIIHELLFRKENAEGRFVVSDNYVRIALGFPINIASIVEPMRR